MLQGPVEPLPSGLNSQRLSNKLADVLCGGICARGEIDLLAELVCACGSLLNHITTRWK